jgi:hypothetical protein
MSEISHCASIWSYRLVHVSGDANYYLPTKRCTLDVQAPRKASTEAPNLSKGEMSFNFSLSISIQFFTTIHHPTQRESSGGATCSLCLALYATMFIELCFNFMSIFTYFYPHVVSCFLSIPLLVWVMQSCHRWVRLRYLRLI